MQGKEIHGYTLQKPLGKGGMAEVWYAENAIHKPAAVKILNRDLSLNEEIVDRFRNEAEIMVRLDHPNIRQVYDYAEIDGRPAIIMEYLDGDDLKARMKQGQRFTNEELVKWWNQLVDALNYTHSEGIIHRDIKPGNIFIDKKGNVKLLDFGIAKIRESISMTQTGAMMGTLMYMSPEQVEDSKHIGPKSDIYSLAVTFVHLLTGKAPYDSNNISDYAIRKGIVEISLDLSGVPLEWRDFLAPYLEKRPENRTDLKYFEEVKPQTIKPKESKEQSNVEDEVTVIDNNEAKYQPEQIKKSKFDNLAKKENPKKTKTILWIILVLIAIGVGVVVMKPSFKSDDNTNQETFRGEDIIMIDEDTEAFNACTSISDYRNYIAYFGRNGKHYLEAKQNVDSFIADSTKKAQDAIKAEQFRKEQERQEKEKADAKARTERKKNANFSVSPNKQIRFSKGNLQYQASTNTWRFAENQWDIIGDENMNVSSNYTGWIDLFGWGTSGYQGKYPYMMNDTTDMFDYGDGENDISGTNYDWGIYNTISNGLGKKWHTLTSDEWKFVLEIRNTNSGIRYVKALVNGVNGIIILPDNWIRSNYNLNDTNLSTANFYVNIISQSDWINSFEANGAVFLPAAGRGLAFDKSIYDVGMYGSYWSTSYQKPGDWGAYARLLLFCSDELNAQRSDSRDCMFSVRLVCSDE